MLRLMRSSFSSHADGVEKNRVLSSWVRIDGDMSFNFAVAAFIHRMHLESCYHG